MFFINSTMEVKYVMKNLLIMLAMGAGLFVYGYVLSTAGHDHSEHSHNDSEQQMHNDGHGEHQH